MNKHGFNKVDMQSISSNAINLREISLNQIKPVKIEGSWETYLITHLKVI